MGAALPPWLHGRLLRNGPGLFAAGPHKLSHLFDGFSLLTSFHIKGGSVFASHRFLESRDYAEAAGEGRIRSRQFGTAATPAEDASPLGFLQGFWGTAVTEEGITDNAKYVPGAAGGYVYRPVLEEALDGCTPKINIPT